MSGRHYVHIVDEDDNSVSPQYPLPTDGDSVYTKDIKIDQSIVTNWIDDDGNTSDENIYIPFTGLHTCLYNTTSDNPKILRIHFKRSINAHQIGIGAHCGDFSNVKIKLLGSGEVVRTTVDDSANNTDYTSNNYAFEPQLFNAVDLEFHTTDAVTVSNITIQKAIIVAAQIYGLRADGTIGVVNVTNGNNLKMSLEELETGVSSNNKSQLNVTMFDSSGNEVETDPIEHSLVTIESEHHQIHEENHYFVGSYDTINDEGTIDIIVTTPDTAIRAHFLATAQSSGEMVASIHEGVTETGDGTPMTLFNSDRNSANTSDLVIKVDPTTVSNTGTLLRAHSGGSSGPFSSGTTARGTSENILKQNTKYMIRLLSNANTNIIDWEFIWYEV